MRVNRFGRKGSGALKALTIPLERKGCKTVFLGTPFCFETCFQRGSRSTRQWSPRSEPKHGYSLWRVRENQFVLPQINDHYVEFV
jgi:hypothetical protein